MAIPSRYWADLGTRDFAALDPATTVAVLPVAATEQHGPHLPLSVDQTLVDGVVANCLPHLPAVLSASKSYSERLFRYQRIDRLARRDRRRMAVAAHAHRRTGHAGFRRLDGGRTGRGPGI